MGLPAGFKSGILLKTATDIKKYNKGMPTKHAGKRKTVLIITMENSVEETVERLFNMTVTTEDIRNYTPKQVIKMLKETGELVLKDDEDIDIVIKYYPNRSIDTNDLYTIVEEIEDDNKEVIALILDYIKRIRSANPNKELRLELGNIVDEMTVIAKTRNIPVISASQLNREGIKVIETAVESGQADIAKKLGGSNVGESWAMIENADWVCIINREYKATTDMWYLTFKQIKTRAKNPTLTYFAHPFEKGNGMKLTEDVGLKEPLSIKAISDELATSDNIASKGRISARRRTGINSSATTDVPDPETVVLGGDVDDFAGLE
jgi:hypothetical protein